MTLLWCDGFDHYGLAEANMLDGPYAEIHSKVTLETANPRAGTHHMRWTTGTSQNHQGFRRVFGAALTTVGVGFAFYMPTVPSVNGRANLIVLRDAANADQIGVTVQSTGAIAVYRGSDETSATLLATSAVLATAGAYNHFEIKATIDNSAGAVEIRLNNVTIIDISGVDTQNTGNAETSQCRILGKWSATVFGGVPSPFDCDDLFAWDTAGSYNNDFIGDHQVLTLWPDGDTAQTDWTRNTGSTDYEAIDEADPDDDTTYVEATAAAQISEYALDDLPSTVSAIAAVQLTGRMKKTDAGGSMVQQGLLSSDVGSPAAPAEYSGADRNITTAYTYWPDISEEDPATGAPWTRTAFNAALYKIERTV